MKQDARRQAILNFLEHEGPLTLRALGGKCGVDPSTLGQDLAWLEQAEIVAKEENPDWRGNGAKVGRYTYRLELDA